MTKRKVKSWMYFCLYVLPLLFVPIYIYSFSKSGQIINLIDILDIVSTSFKIDVIYSWLLSPIELLVSNVSTNSFAVYIISYFSYIILLTFIDILVDALLWIPNLVHKSIERGCF